MKSSALLLVLAACASATPAPINAPVTTSAAPAPEDKKVECDLVCERAELAVKPAAQPDYTVAALQNANDVLEAMHPSMLACYKKRVAVSPNAHAFLTVDVVIGPDGHVLTVETTGGALLGDATMGCIVDQIRRAQFAPPHGGGTLHISVPFSLRRVSPGEEG